MVIIVGNNSENRNIPLPKIKAVIPYGVKSVLTHKKEV